jgi:hypothetical protein
MQKHASIYPPLPVLSEVEQAVADYLALLGAEYSAPFLCRSDEPLGGDGNKWEHDRWNTSISLRGATLRQVFHTGSGHRLHPKTPDDLRGVHPSSLAIHDFRRANPAKPVAPCAANFLHSMLLDAQGAEDTFSVWCSEFGYDTDSRRARDTYDVCQGIRDDLHSVFRRDELATLEEMLQDY